MRSKERPAPAQAADEPSPTVEVPAPPPEPWTPERVLEWNRYYDLFIIVWAWLLVFIGGIHPILNASIWSDLQTGRLIRQQGGPVTTDPFSYTMEGARWVDIPWLFQAGNALVYDAAQRLRPATGESTAAAALILLNALISSLAVLVLLGARRPGPGTWWVAVCAVLALGGIIGPIHGGTSPVMPMLGGIAGPADLHSSTWGLLLLAIELVLIVRALRGSRGALYALVPLLVVWVNVADSFLIGLLILVLRALAVPFERTPPGKDAPARPSAALWLGVTLACAAGTLVNPWLWEVYPAAAAPFLKLFGPATGVLTHDQISFFGSQSWNYFDTQLHDAAGAYRYYVGYYLILVGIGLASFVLNRRRFSWGRLLVFVVIAALWGALRILSPVFALVWAVTLAQNGQEWYQGRFGVVGRVGSGWAAWSVGGRALTLLLIFALIFKGLTGRWSSPAEPVFGLGASPERWAFEAARYLGESPIEGQILNFTLAHGDALIWNAWPINRARKTFIDSRKHLFPPSIQQDLGALRRALADGDAAAWRSLLEKYDENISVVMLPMTGDVLGTGRTYQALAGSDDWIPFYDDGGVMLFGRADAPEADLAYFREHRLDAQRLAFRTGHPVPSSDRIPTPTSWIDRIFLNRGRRLPQPHVWAAQRWLTIRNEDPNAPPDLANSLLAIGQARAGLAQNPDDPASWRVLDEAYRLLTSVELQILSEAGLSTPPQDLFRFRLEQRLAALNFAIQSSPPPQTRDGREGLSVLHLELAELYLNVGYNDLALEQLRAARDLIGVSALPATALGALVDLEEGLSLLESYLADLTAQQQAGPLQLAEAALGQGAPGIAIRELSEAESAGISPAAVKAQLVDLYCQVGMPEKALELISSGSIEDPALSTGPGTASYRQARVYFLIGSYDLTVTYWRDRSIPQLRYAIASDALESTRGLLSGFPREVSESLLELPSRIQTRATWETQLGLCLLEAGRPQEAITHFQAALEAWPEIPTAPLLRVYLERLGSPHPADTDTPPDSSMPAGSDAFATPAPE